MYSLYLKNFLVFQNKFYNILQYEMKEEPAIFYGIPDEDEEEEDGDDGGPKPTAVDLLNARYAENPFHDSWQRRVWVCLV